MTVSRLYYLGNKINIKFRIDNANENTLGVDTQIYDSQGNPISDVLLPVIAGKQVELELPKDIITDFGDYVALFKIHGQIEDKAGRPVDKDYPVYFAVATPDTQRTSGLPVEQLTKESSDNELDSAVSESIRELRRTMDSVEAERIALNTARINTEKDLIPRELLQESVRDALSGLKVVVSL